MVIAAEYISTLILSLSLWSITLSVCLQNMKVELLYKSRHLIMLLALFTPSPNEQIDWLLMWVIYSLYPNILYFYITDTVKGMSVKKGGVVVSRVESGAGWRGVV